MLQWISIIIWDSMRTILPLESVQGRAEDSQAVQELCCCLIPGRASDLPAHVFVLANHWRSLTVLAKLCDLCNAWSSDAGPVQM